jgi:membrane protein
VPNLCTFGGLSAAELLRRTVRASWNDDVFGQGGRMAFYQFLAIFPSFLIAFTVVKHVGPLSHHLRVPLSDVSTELFPARVSELFEKMVENFSGRPRVGLRLLSVGAGAVWAAHNGTWSMIYGLNRAYEVHEDRSWQRLTLTIVALTVAMAATGLAALLFIFCGAYLQEHVRSGAVLLRVLEWVAVTAGLYFCFVLLYRYAPNLKGHALRWCTPGGLFALVLWLGCSFGAHVYFDHIDNYGRSYGPVNGVVMLLLWLYASNGALLMGGEMNSAIAKAEGGCG